MDMELAPKESAKKLPADPGIYRFLDNSGTLIYVGKAKDLRKRVASYFLNQSQQNRKTQKLVSEIRRIEFTVTPSEFEALLLENNFIKEYQPKYNILLKDDKTFPYLCILNERFPRVISTRKFIEGQGEYFGPYASVGAMNSVLDLVRRLYAIRTCSLLLSENNIQSGKFKVCLEFHLGNCRGPCENRQSEEVYLEDIKQARKILKGHLSEVTSLYEESMAEASSRLEFETAEVFRKKLELLSRFRSKNSVVNHALSDLDVITIFSDEHYAWINLMQVKEGSVIFSQNAEVEKQLDESDEEIIAVAYQNLKKQSVHSNHEIISNVEFILEPGATLSIPRIGDKKKLIDLSLRNAATLQQRRLESQQIRKNENPVLVQMRADLRLQSLPQVIECFDNSNLQGSNPVASMVQFYNGKPKKSAYRHFNVKSVEGPDDFASMQEIVTRRYDRLQKENATMPDLIIVDGGKGQLSSACKALSELGLYGKLPIIGIAKNLEEIFFPEDQLPLMLSKRSSTLRLIQQIRDEAHRFGLKFHRLKRSQTQTNSALSEIPGIGASTMEKLIKHFKSLKKIELAGYEAVKEMIGAKKAKMLFTGLTEIKKGAITPPFDSLHSKDQ
ncbi:MAG: excinuclease ABC subunit C [Bacteroidetes bacterium]|nr:excinuclease ABC subunit C [Bacteroidota bacterium]